MIVPVILSGGSGTRLWPLSRERYPKQFLPLVISFTDVLVQPHMMDIATANSKGSGEKARLLS